MNRLAVRLAAVVAAVGVVAGPAVARELKLEQRIAAPEAIDRVYHAHRIGAPPFEQAVPRSVIEQRALDDLRLTDALVRRWGVRVTPGMIDAELRRIARATRLPGRLREIERALGDDPFVLRECFARSSLVRRLALERFAADRAIQAVPRRTAERILDDLRAGRLDPANADPRRRVVDYVVADDPPNPEHFAAADTIRLAVDAAELERRSAEAAGGLRLIERSDAFVVVVPLSRGDGRLVLATWPVAKRDWSSWWGEHAAEFAADPRAIVVDGGALPATGRAVAGECVVADDWMPTAVGEDAPVPRTDHTAVWTGSEMIVWGGRGPRNDGGIYDPTTDSWSPVPLTDAPAPRFLHTAVWTGTTMIVWGGWNGQALLSGGIFDPTSGTWTPTNEAGAPTSRRDHTAVWTGSTMIVWGGRNRLGATLPLQDGAMYDPSTDTWNTLTTTDAPAGAFGHTAVWTGDSMIVWGGEIAVNTYTSDGARFMVDGETGTWTALDGTDAPPARRDHSAVWADGRMIVWGGTGKDETNADVTLGDGAAYDLATDTWTAISATDAPAPRALHTAVWTGDEMIVWGGEPYTDEGGRYDPVGDAWTPTATAGAPAPRRNHTAVWTGTEMIVWGGDDPAQTGTGGRYDPVGDSWTPTAASSAPLNRALHTAVWTGSEMIVWGGSNLGVLASGGRWDPLTDAWSPTTLVDAPAGRQRHTAVWSGSRMVVWGGQPSTDTGGRYDPVADAWAATSTTNAPSARFGHTAVWTGTEMIVWGGYDDLATETEGLTDSGGRYDPDADSWTATSTTDPPTARSGHTAVWTGTGMIVWGGADIDGLTDTGSRYDPMADAWTATAIGGAPTPRREHRAVRAGTRMIVWGGRNELFPLGSGGVYDSTSDHWSTILNSGAPSPRYDFTAVWTGSKFVVWGGWDGEAYVDSGGSYSPDIDRWTDDTTTVGAPSPRGAHTAVWTGDEMVVWGGFGDGLLASGGRYTVAALPDGDGDGWPCDVDCDDGDASINPGATDACDGIDNDCNGLIDDGSPDSDRDTVRDDCDNCVDRPNASQADIDADGQGDACDSSDGVIYVVVGPNGDGLDLVSWDAEQGFDAWNLYRGDLAVLRQGGPYTQEPGSSGLADRQCALGGTSAVDDSTPSSSEVAYFLVSGSTGGVEGALGDDSSGTPRPNANPCP